MRGLLLGCAVIALSSGCANDTELRKVNFESELAETADILQTVRCEIDRAQAEHEAIHFDSAVIVSTLTVTESRGQSGSLILAQEVAKGMLTVTGNNTPSNVASSIIQLTTPYRVGTAKSCNNLKISGGLGILEWLEGMDALAQADQVVPTDISQQVNFNISLNRDLTPKFVRDIDQLSTTVSGKRTANRSYKHDVKITINPDQRPGSPRVSVAEREALQDFVRSLPDT